MFKIAVLVSGSGTNMTKLIENNILLDCIIADRECYAIQIAKNNNIKTFLLERNKELSDKVLKILKDRKINLVVLAGFLSILNGKILKKYEKKIINIHPSLLPKYGGVGMHGLNVHKAVFKSKDMISGCTVHYVNEKVDSGDIIDQIYVDISEAKSPEEIQKKVLLKEWELLPKVVKKFIDTSKEL